MTPVQFEALKDVYENLDNYYAGEGSWQEKHFDALRAAIELARAVEWCRHYEATAKWADTYDGTGKVTVDDGIIGGWGKTLFEAVCKAWGEEEITLDKSTCDESNE